MIFLLNIKTNSFKKILLVLYFISTGLFAKSQLVADFVASPTMGCEPLVVSFTDKSTGGPTSWQWDLGNGTIANQQNPTTTYFTNGVYNITLTVTNANGSNTITKSQYIIVNDKPNVDFQVNNTSGCFPLRVNFTDLSTSGTTAFSTWSWDFGDGTTSTLQNPTHNYLSSGTFPVSLTVTNAGGCSKTISRPNYIQVATGVNVNFTNSIPQLCKAPEVINFTNTSTGPGILSYQWDFGDGGTSTATNPSHNYLTAGNFNVTLITQSDLGCIDTLTIPNAVIIKNNSTDFSFTNPICKGANNIFQNSSIPLPTSSIWDFGDGTSANTINTNKIFTSVSTYNIKLINIYSGCKDSVTKQINVLNLPTPNFTALKTSDCNVPFLVNFSDLSIGATTWKWNFGDGSTSTLQNPSHTYTNLGNYTVSLIISNANGCSDSITINQFVKISKPAVAINPINLNGCVPFTIKPTPNVNSVDGVATYLWDFGDGATSNQQNPTHIYNVQGKYPLKLYITTNGGCIDSSVVDTVLAGNKPIIDFNANPTTQCVGSIVQFNNLTIPSDKWLWKFGDGGTSVVQNPTYIYTDTGHFTINLIAWNFGCVDSLKKINYITALPPVAKFNPVYTCNNKLIVTFSDQSVLPQTWAWDFGDGTTSNQQNPVHTYATYANYLVTLTVTNLTCSNTTTQTISLFNETANFKAINDTICINNPAIFKATGSVASNIASYLWDYGDGITETTLVDTAFHKYNAAGLYSITLTITDTKGCTSTFTKLNYLKVFGPVANFTFLPTKGCKPLLVTFTDLSIPDGVHLITNWNWDFGDNILQVSTTPPFNHIYNSSGLFTPKLTVIDNLGCSNFFTSTQTVYVTSPQAIFTSTDTLACVNKLLTFTNNSTGVALKYNWDFGDGTTSNILNPTKMFSVDGDYTIKLTVTDTNFCTNTLINNNYIHVRTPKASFIVSDTVSSCSPFKVDFTNTSINSVSANWNFGDGYISNVFSPTHFFTNTGVYNVKLTAKAAGGCIDSFFYKITLFPSIASLTYNPITGCSPLSISFHVSTPGVVKYLWDFSDGNTIATTDSNVIHTFSLPVKFLPKVILEDPTGCQIPVLGLDSIKIIKSNVYFKADDTIHCDIGNVNFIDSSISNSNIANYNWTFGDGGISNIKNPTYLYNNTGLYSVRLIVKTIEGCSDTAIKNNYIKIVASPKISIVGNVPICLKNKIIFNSNLLIPDTSLINWKWNFGNGKTSILPNPLPILYDSAGTYPLQLSAINSSGCVDTINTTVLVNPLPIVNAGLDTTIISGTDAQISATSTPVISYLWSPSASINCPFCASTIAAPKITTTYTIKVTDANGCVNKDDVTVFVICNNANVFIPNTFSPNNDGVNDIFYPRGTGLYKIQNFRIFNRWGEMIFRKTNLYPNDPTFGWDGTYNGKLQLTDVYIYIIDIICENNQILTFKGNIALMQ